MQDSEAQPLNNGPSDQNLGAPKQFYLPAKETVVLSFPLHIVHDFYCDALTSWGLADTARECPFQSQLISRDNK